MKLDEKFKITNVVLSGKNVARKFSWDEFQRIIKNGKLVWDVVNEDMSPILQVRFQKHGTNVQGRMKSVCVSFWTSGSVNIVGVLSKEEGIAAYREAMKDIKQALNQTSLPPSDPTGEKL